MSKYRDLSFQELRKECKERGLAAGGDTQKLIERLVNYDLGQPDEEPKGDAALGDAALEEARTIGLKATDPNPKNPNYDMTGRWIRRKGDVRPDGKVSVDGRWDKCA